MENFNGMIIGQGQCEMKKKRDAGPKISPSLSSKRASSLFTKKRSTLTPSCFGKAAAVIFGCSFHQLPHPSARQAEPSQNRAGHSSS